MTGLTVGYFPPSELIDHKGRASSWFTGFYALRTSVGLKWFFSTQSGSIHAIERTPHDFGKKYALITV